MWIQTYCYSYFPLIEDTLFQVVIETVRESQVNLIEVI